jgi:hypothetical protein
VEAGCSLAPTSQNAAWTESGSLPRLGQRFVEQGSEDWDDWDGMLGMTT